jgi:hypothetical protein
VTERLGKHCFANAAHSMQSRNRNVAAAIIIDQNIEQRGKLVRTFHEVDGQGWSGDIRIPKFFP